MGKHKPRSGSLQFYPRKKAKKETPTFGSFPRPESEQPKPVNFFGYKAGMAHGIARDEHKKSATSGMQVQVPLTVIECPPLKVFGVRACGRGENGEARTLVDIIAPKAEKHLARKIAGIQKKKKEHSIEALEKRAPEISEIRLLVHTQPYSTTIGKKRPEVSELALSGNVEKQLEYAKQKLGKEVSVKEVFGAAQFVDVKAVTTGKGMQGPVKRFGVKTHRPKAKKQRTVGTLGPWNPSTVMWTIARPGQMGYHSRTEFNKRILAVEADGKKLNPAAGFENYGSVRNEAVLLAGSVPGPVKRLIALRLAMRPAPENKWNVSDLRVKNE